MKGKCIDIDIIPIASIAHSAVSFTADWIFVFLPIVLIWNLQMNRRTKLSLAAILCLGLLSVPLTPPRGIKQASPNQATVQE